MENTSKFRGKIRHGDRFRALIALSVILLIMAVSAMRVYSYMSIFAAVSYVFTSTIWLQIAFGVEALHQAWIFFCERNLRVNALHTKLLSFYKRKIHSKLDSNLRYHSSKVGWIIVKLAFGSYIASLLTKSTNWWTGLIDLPSFLLSPTFFPYVLLALMQVVSIIFVFYFVSRGGYDVYQPGQIKTRFTDVWGQDHVVEKVKETVLFLENPEDIEKHGGYVPGGILLWGPPGTGKTLLAEAIAGETGKPYVFVEPGAFQAMFVGVGIMKVKTLFRKLRKLALSHDGVVVFIDEADSLGARNSVGKSGKFRSSPGQAQAVGCSTSSAVLNISNSYNSDNGVEDVKSGRRSRYIAGGGTDMGQLQALLTELSGLTKPRGLLSKSLRNLLGLPPATPPKYRILVILATNMPDVLDEALLRPGRVDRVFRVGYPSGAGRLRTYKGYLDKVSHTLTDIQIEKLSAITPYATGASIKDMVNEAVIGAVRDGRSVVTWNDLMQARRLRELGPGEGVEYIERERHSVAIHEACHGVVAVLMRSHLRVDMATISKGGNYLGMVASVPPSEQFTAWRSHFEADIMVALASLVGERYFFENDSTSGVQGDLAAASHVAKLMQSSWGMGDQLYSQHLTEEDKGLSNEQIEKKVEVHLGLLYERTRKLIIKERARVLALAHALEVYRDLDGADVEAVVKYTQGPIVDGRVYAIKANAKALEQYHTRAVTAHKDGSSEQLQLPVFNTTVEELVKTNAVKTAPRSRKATPNTDLKNEQ